MISTSPTKTLTLIDALKSSFELARRAPEGVAEPVALIWTDADKQWAPIIPELQNCIPELFVFGSYNPAKRTGPAIWLKCIVDRTLPALAVDSNAPILYLPGVSRQELRAGGDCPTTLQPLIELQYRGTVWHQRNGRDWTVESFLVSESGLGLDISQDSRTREALLRALAIMAKEPVEHFRDRRLDAQDFDKLSISDPVRDVLLWMNEPTQFEQACDPSRWQTFRDVALREFGFDPGNRLPNEAAGAIVKGGGKWEDVWVRFSEAPHLYPGITVLLRAPERYLPIHLSRSPAYNEEQEQKLRNDLMSCAEYAHSKCCESISSLEQQHSERRSWIWARIGESPLATSLEPLSRLANLAKTITGGTSVAQFIQQYTSIGWQCDGAAIEALSTNLSASDFAMVSKLIRALYEPWLDQTTRHFQTLLLDELKSSKQTSPGVFGEKDTCILFVDGLRFDVGQQLVKMLSGGRGFSVSNSHRLAPLPTVTATAKPLCCPAHSECKGGTEDSEFTPLLNSGQPATIRRLRDEMARLGVEVIEPSETGNPLNSKLGGWTEIGRLDELGHKLGTRMARQIQFELEVISDRIATLLAAGWRRVHVVTDHGWLLLPGGLPKVHVPPHLVVTKWSRCAVISGRPELSVPTFSWYWNEDVKMACPPGIGSFLADNEYTHGGISPQECVIPDLWIELAEQPSRSKIVSVAWRGMRCKVTIEGTTKSKLLVDVRLSWRNKDSSISASAKEFGESGEASIVVADDKHEGTAAVVVLIDSSGNVIDYQPTTVGEDEK